MEVNVSKKKYSVAVVLCGIFGMFGIHHFYIGNVLHGIFDLSLLITGLVLITSPDYVGLGVFLLFLDFLHTVVVFFKLLVENQKDGSGRIIVLEIHKQSDQE